VDIFFAVVPNGQAGRWTHNVVAAVDIFFAVVANDGIVLYHVEVVKGVEWKGRQGR